MADRFKAELFERLPSERQVREVLKSLSAVEEAMQRSDFIDRVPNRAARRRELMDHLARTRVAFEDLLTSMVKADGSAV